MNKVILALLLFIPQWVVAVEPEKDHKVNSLTAAAIVEGIILINSGLAAASPKGFGWVMTAISPFVLAGDGSTYTNSVGALGFAAIGQYNAQELKNEEYSKSDIFKRNFIAMNALFGLTYITEKLTGEKIVPENVAVIPEHGGVTLALSYQF
tara:strand:- start:2110 stop:2565 length:456 start_codon:yes stop_codon:yes gene_type:complete